MEPVTASEKRIHHNKIKAISISCKNNVFDYVRQSAIQRNYRGVVGRRKFQRRKRFCKKQLQLPKLEGIESITYRRGHRNYGKMLVQRAVGRQVL